MQRLVYWLGTVLMLAAPVLAQTYQEEPAKTMTEKGGGMESIFGAVFLVGCLVVAFKPAKRAVMK